MGKICIIIKYVIDSYPFVRAPSDHVITEPPINGKSSDVRIFFVNYNPFWRSKNFSPLFMSDMLLSTDGEASTYQMH